MVAKDSRNYDEEVESSIRRCNGRVEAAVPSVTGAQFMQPHHVGPQIHSTSCLEL